MRKFNRPARPGKGPRMTTASAEINKIVNAANRFGNPGIKDQQLTTFEIYHYLPYQATGSLEFFRSVNTAVFPFANIQENRLQVGETMVINRVWFTLAKVSEGKIEEVISFDQATATGLYLSQFTWNNDNNRVIKQLSLTQMQPNFNRKGFNVLSNVLHLETDITVQPLVRFTALLQLANVPNDLAAYYIGCHAAGVGTLLAPKTTY